MQRDIFISELNIRIYKELNIRIYIYIYIYIYMYIFFFSHEII